MRRMTTTTQKALDALREAALSLPCTCGRDLMTAEQAEAWTPGHSGHLRHCHARYRDEMLLIARGV
jgi:hypothetical protein